MEQSGSITTAAITSSAGDATDEVPHILLRGQVDGDDMDGAIAMHVSREQHLVHQETVKEEDTNARKLLSSPSDHLVRPYFTGEHVTMGGLADSTYEYMLKQYILDGKKDDWLLQMYVDAMQGMRYLLLAQTGPSTALVFPSLVR